MPTINLKTLVLLASAFYILASFFNSCATTNSLTSIGSSNDTAYKIIQLENQNYYSYAKWSYLASTIFLIYAAYQEFGTKFSIKTSPIEIK